MMENIKCNVYKNLISVVQVLNNVKVVQDVLGLAFAIVYIMNSDYLTFQEYSTPEIRRVPLDSLDVTNDFYGFKRSDESKFKRNIYLSK